MNGFTLWLAQGFGVGRIPIAPGTFGSLVGLLWLVLLAQSGSPGVVGIGIVAGLAASVLVCSRAERILKEKDSSSIVLDEITAVPICFVPWLAAEWSRSGRLPSVETFFEPPTLYATAAIVALFRILDIAKVWPASFFERWPGGWGITADDVMAALYVALLTWLFVF